MYTNINIINDNDQFTYILKYDETSYSYNWKHTNKEFQNEVYIRKNSDGQILRKNNTYYEKVNCKFSGELMCGVSEVVLYIPNFSVDTYESDISYVLKLDTYIHDKIVNIASLKFNRLDTIACDKVYKFGDQQYYECIKFDIPNIRQLLYSDDFRDFRINVCGEDERQYNDTGAILYASLYPVKSNNTIELLDNYVGGQNSINISSLKNDYINLHIYHNLDSPLRKNEEPSIFTELNFNEFYEGNLTEYLRETYNISKFKIKCGLVIGNEDDLYVNLESYGDENNYNFNFTKTEITQHNFDNWSGWKEGINIICSLDILDENDESLLYLISNQIPLTQELFKYFVGGYFKNGKTSINNINLDLVNMNIYDINTYNKVENNIIKINNPEGTSKNIIQPIFYRSQSSSDIINIYPEVTQNIELNIPNIKQATLQIENVKFNNIGINNGNMVFKIIGKLLPQKINEGTYFILDDNGVMVYSGKYKYIR